MPDEKRMDKQTNRLVDAIARGDEGEMLNALAVLQEQAPNNALSSPILLGIAEFITKHPDHVEAMQRTLYRWSPNDIIGALAYSYLKENFGTPEECVKHVMSAGDDVAERMADQLWEQVQAEGERDA